MRRSVRVVLQTGAVAVAAALVGLLVQRTLVQGSSTQLLSDLDADKRPAAREFELPVIWPRAETWPAARLIASAEEHKGEVVFLGLDVQDFESDARRFLERYQTNYVSVRDGGDSTYSDYGLTGLPETYYLDRTGRVVAHSLGGISEEELAAGVAAALAERYEIG